MFAAGLLEFNWLIIFICLGLEVLFLFKLAISNKIIPTKNKLRFLTHGSLLFALVLLFIFSDETTRHYLLQGRKGAIFFVNGSFKLFLVAAIGLSVLNEFLFQKKRIVIKEQTDSE